MSDTRIADLTWSLILESDRITHAVLDFAQPYSRGMRSKYSSRVYVTLHLNDSIDLRLNSTAWLKIYDCSAAITRLLSGLTHPVDVTNGMS